MVRGGRLELIPNPEAEKSYFGFPDPRRRHGLPRRRQAALLMHILTFDIEEWFHLLEHDEVRSEASWAASTASCRACSTASWICSTSVATRRPSSALAGSRGNSRPDPRHRRAGHEIGSHSDLHTLIFEQSPQQFRAELQPQQGLPEQVVGKPVRMFRAPGFSLIPSACSWAFDVLIEEGFEVDCSIFPRRPRPRRLPKLPVRPARLGQTANRRIENSR